jgi:hypothetical protein
MRPSVGPIFAMALIGGAATVARAEAPAAADAPPLPTTRGGPVELAIFGGPGGLVGPAGVSAAYLPVSRLALGLAVGQARNELEFGDIATEWRVAPFVRGYVIDRPSWRVGLGLATTTGNEVTHHAGTAVDGTPAVVYWHLDDARRVDGSAVLELVRGNLALRFEAALGRVFGGSSSCVARFDGAFPCQADPRYPSGEPDVLEATPSPWRRSLQVALVVRPGGRATPESLAAGAATVPALPAAAGRWRVSLAATHVRGTDLFSDGHYFDGPRFDAGIEAEYLRRTGGLRWGVGARYSYGIGQPLYDRHDESEHVAFVPALLGWAWRSPVTGEELELLGGFGPALMALSFGARSGEDVWVAGPGGEIGVSYIRPLTATGRLAIVVGVSARVLAVTEVSGGDQFIANRGGFHHEIPAHVGVRF